jgi:predicted phage terminase large subunit-like protein
MSSKTMQLPSKAELLTMSPDELEVLEWRLRWRAAARYNQLQPDGDWSVWLILAGRGFGKTRTGAETLGEWAWDNPKTRWAIVAPTTSDVRDTCFEGESGLVNVIPQKLIHSYNRSLSEMTLTNGSYIKGFSSQEPERLRGPQFHGHWYDELAAWDYPDETWDMAQFGLRLGSHPKIIVTTTPKPVVLVRRLWEESKDPRSGVVLTTGSTYENRDNLAPNFFKQIQKYEGTKLGRQEIHAEVLDPEEDGIIKRSWFKLWPHDKPLPYLEFIVQSYDTAFTEKTENDMTVCTTWGVFSTKSGDYAALLLDSWGERMMYPDLREKAATEYLSLYGEQARGVDCVLIEDKGSGITLRQDLERAGVRCRPYNPQRADKTSRLHAVSHLFLHGRVFVPESKKYPGKPRTWCEVVISQLCSFPNVEHDDYVDSVTQALTLLRDQLWLSIDKYDDDDDNEPTSVKANPYAT